MTFARWGLPTLFWATLVLGWGVWLLPDGWPRWIGYAVAGFCWLFTLAFFRNPQRQPQGNEQCLIAPADGIVADISEVEETEFIRGRAVRIGIFLSVFDVHVNRSSMSGTIAYAQYTPGKFLDARHPNASYENEANTIGMIADDSVASGLKILIRQLSGLIARRIICVYGVGDRLNRGDLYGMIKFGSRTELWVPLSYPHTVNVQVGQRVKCGETILVTLQHTADKVSPEVAAPVAPSQPVAPVLA